MDNTFLEDTRIFRIVYDMLAKNLFEFANIVDPLCQIEIARSLTVKIEKDRDALREKDPAAQLFGGEKGNEYVLSYKSLEAVMMYRICNYIYNFGEDDSENSDDSANINFLFKNQARKLSDKTKVNTSVEIHPAAQIGERFVIDHGCSTVIGETCEIGNGCYILHGVTLGSMGIGTNERGRRHPKLGNNVEIGGFARLFGDISIGDNTIINGYTVVDRDIPADKKVSVVNQLQLCRSNLKSKADSESVVIYGLRPYADGLEIIGKNLRCCTAIELLNGNVDALRHFSATIESRSDSSVVFSIDDIGDIINDPDIKSYKIALYYDDNDILLANSVGWNDYIKNKKSSI